MRTACEHTYHARCVQGWAARSDLRNLTCPVCRRYAPVGRMVAFTFGPGRVRQPVRPRGSRSAPPSHARGGTPRPREASPRPLQEGIPREEAILYPDGGRSVWGRAGFAPSPSLAQVPVVRPIPKHQGVKVPSLSLADPLPPQSHPVPTDPPVLVFAASPCPHPGPWRASDPDPPALFFPPLDFGHCCPDHSFPPDCLSAPREILPRPPSPGARYLL
jgi:hypothetical protein